MGAPGSPNVAKFLVDEFTAEIIRLGLRGWAHPARVLRRLAEIFAVFADAV